MTDELKKPVRDFEDTQRVGSVLKDEFFPAHDLKGLSERATAGELRLPTTEEADENYDCLYDPDDCHQMTTRQALTINGADPVLHLYSFKWTDDEIDANAEYICRLWNDHRSGSLVPVERVEPGWQPIETAPKDGTTVLLYPAPYLGWGGVVGYWAAHHKAWNGQTNDGWLTPTHWMPLPAPPTLKGGTCNE